MMIMRFLALSLCALVCASIPIASSDDDSVFTNDFAVEIDGDDDVADLVAGTHGFKLVSRVSGCFGVCLFIISFMHISTRSKGIYYPW